MEADARFPGDRRKKPTPALSRYTLWGRRKGFRRKIDGRQGGYVDRYGAGLFFVLVLVIVLNIFDSVLTMIILNNGGEEANPVIGYFMQVSGTGFWVWKFIITSCSLLLLCVHSQFKRYKALHAIIGASFVYVMVLLYQVHLILNP
jgi:hypothetical protein